MTPDAPRPALPARRRMLLGGLGYLLAQRALAQAAPALNDVLDAAGEVGALRALAVMRDGQLLAQRAYNGASLDTLFRINSATKSVSSMLVGSTIARGKLQGLSQTLGELLPETAAAYPGSAAADVTLGQVLTGTTGLKYDWMTEFRRLGGVADPSRYAFELPREVPAGTAWSYNDAAVGLLSHILERARGTPLPEIARQDLFNALGIDKFEWRRDRTGRATSYAGLQLRVADLAKLAWVMVNGGQWQGEHILPAEWVTQSLRRHIDGAWPNPPISGSGYGYLWFTGRHGNLPLAWAWGYGAQFAVVAPTLRLAIATAATEPSPQQLPAQNMAMAGLVVRILDSFT